MNQKPTRGEVLTIVLVVIAILGGGIFVLKPKWLHGDSKRAKDSATATAKVETSTAKVDAATEHQAATAAASVVKIGEALASAPASPEKDFAIREVPVALANLPKPDPEALLAAERRRVAVMEGRLEEAGKLYADATKQAAQLTKERDAATAELIAARAERASVDQRLAEVAAERRVEGQQRAILSVVVVLVLLGWAYTKFYSINPASIGRVAADIRAGISPIQALDTHLAPWLHGRVSKAAKLSTDLDAEENGTPTT